MLKRWHDGNGKNVHTINLNLIQIAFAIIIRHIYLYIMKKGKNSRCKKILVYFTFTVKCVFHTTFSNAFFLPLHFLLIHSCPPYLDIYTHGKSFIMDRTLENFLFHPHSYTRMIKLHTYMRVCSTHKNAP